MPNILCPCGSTLAYESCCAPYIKGEQHAPTVAALVRSRYSAFCLHEFAYLVETTHPDFRDDLDVDTIAQGTEKVQWLRLDLGESGEVTRENGEVFEQISFSAYYEQDGVARQLSETSFFTRQDDRLYYVDGVPHKAKSYTRSSPKCGRNDPCPCGSGKKYKKCCATGTQA